MKQVTVAHEPGIGTQEFYGDLYSGSETIVADTPDNETIVADTPDNETIVADTPDNEVLEFGVKYATANATVEVNAPVTAVGTRLEANYLPREITTFEWGLDVCKNNDGLLVDNVMVPHDHVESGVENTAMWVESDLLQLLFDDGYEGAGPIPTKCGVMIIPERTYTVQARVYTPSDRTSVALHAALGEYTPGEAATASSHPVGATVALTPGVWATVFVTFTTSSTEDYLCGISLVRL